MDSGRPFRITRPDDGRQSRTPARTTTSRSAETTPAVEKPSTPPVQVSSSMSSDAVLPEKTKQTSPKRKRSTKKFGVVGLIAGIIILVGAAVFLLRPLLPLGPSLPNADQYQAVTLTDGQIYFGKVKTAGAGYIEIDDGYYLQPATSASAEGGQPDTGKLVKLSNRLYSPSGNIVIPIAQVLTFETLDPDGQIVQMMGKQ